MTDRIVKLGAWCTDVALGGVVGAVIGAIVAVNTVIYGGITEGYEASPAEVFDERPFIGVLAAGALLAGPVFGIWIARRLRRTGRFGPSANGGNG